MLTLAAAGAQYLLAQASLRARLMRADPGSIAQNAELRNFALAYAQPAYDSNCAGCHGNHMQGDAT